MQIEIKNLTKLSFNVYKNQHWAKQKKFKDALRMLVHSATKQTVFHYCKIIEDKLFDQDKDNRQICVNVKKGLENKCTLYLSKL